MRFWLKRCPRCRQGDLREETDTYGRYVACVQCGYILSAAQEALMLGISQPVAEPARSEERVAA